ncbi:MAG: aspartate/glutamate racemase family protein [candidate division KSB1 bacterium]|nr:aspartate/glutamate racemase family protein [candidate division KSB1 bacterium]
MKTIGLIGGMSWESTVSYYKAINEGVKARLGGLHSAKICMVSVDFHEIEIMQHRGDWDATSNILVKAARSVEAGGADFLLICTNTMHKVAPQIEAAVTIPVLHIADATAEKLKTDGISRVGLLGTRFTMEQEFYKDRIKDKFDIDVLIPNDQERDIIHSIIYDELCLGKIESESREQYIGIIEALHAKGAQAVILGCTEIALLVQQEHTEVSLYDTAAIHAAAAVDMSLIHE